MRAVRKVRRLIRTLLLLLLLAAAAGALYLYLLPMLESSNVNTYEAYTVRRGSIETENSFSATISIASSCLAALPMRHSCASATAARSRLPPTWVSISSNLSVNYIVR